MCSCLRRLSTTADPRGSIRATQDEGLSASHHDAFGERRRGGSGQDPRVGRCPPWQGDAHHDPGQGRHTSSGSAGPRLHRRSPEPGLGDRFRAPRGVCEPWRWWEATVGCLSQQACGSWRAVDHLGMGWFVEQSSTTTSRPSTARWGSASETERHTYVGVRPHVSVVVLPHVLVSALVIMAWVHLR